MEPNFLFISSSTHSWRYINYVMQKKLGISKKQGKFLNEYLRTKSLEDLLPLYAAAISNNTEIFKVLPENLINSILESLKKIQETVDLPVETEQTNFSQESILRNLRTLDGKALLSSYIFSITQNSNAYIQISEEIRQSSEGWLDELRACVTGRNGLFSNEFDPETYVDGFIKFVGGKRITEIVGTNVQTDNADYYFPDDNVIIELKILKTDFLETNRDKLKAAQSEFLKTAKITPGMILGTDWSYPEELFLAHFKILREPLQRITKKANNQIKNSKELLNSANAAGIAMYLIDGFYSVNIYALIDLLHEPITRQFSGVNAIIVVTFRRKVTLDAGDGDYDYFVFQPRYKPNYPESLPNFIDPLGDLWFRYMELLSGKKFSKRIISDDPRNLARGIWK